jgi:DNA-binding transcriptional MerR regulator
MSVATPTEMTIAEAAREAGVSVHTLRYYERAGLLTPIERNGSGHRRFTPEDVEWVVVCTKLRATKMPIRRIREYAERSWPATATRRRGWRCWRHTASTCWSA